jgi:hypothetical protein
MIKFTNLLILLCSLLPLGAQQWYRSNNLGMMLEEIEDPLQEEWTLQQNIQGNIQQKILYVNEEERRRWDLELLTDGQTEQRFYLEGILLYIQKYDDQDRLIEEQWYQAGELDNTQIYHYPQDRLILRDIMDPQGNILLHDEFRLDHQGRLLWLKRQSFSDQDMPVNSSSLSGFTQHWEIPGNLDSGWVMRR